MDRNARSTRSTDPSRITSNSRSPLQNALSLSDTVRVHSKSPLHSVAPIPPSTSQRENTLWNVEIDSRSVQSSASPLIKPRVDANRIVKHAVQDRCSNCSESDLLLKTKEREIRTLQDEISILQEKLAVGRDEISRLQNELILYKDCIAMAKEIADESIP